ncbi:MAG: hypothetical protein K0B10_03165 [Vicingaceae bacterium]|nr:hypothetical protein [Vicingaceae bacterium]
MRYFFYLLFVLSFTFCTPKGPQTFSSPFIGKTKAELISSKGSPTQIKIYDKSEIYIYKSKEEYYGKKQPISKNGEVVKPKKTSIIEYIYYINDKEIIYKYQVWKKVKK